MAKHFVVATRDRAAETFNQPFLVPHPQVAVRGFSNEANRSAADNMMFQHPDDFELYELGLYDDSTGRFELLESPRLVAVAKDLKRVVN